VSAVFELLLLGSSVLAVAVLLVRLRRVEQDRDRLLNQVDDRKATNPQADTLAALGMLTSEISHMVISPLTVILGLCELARSAGTEKARFETIQRQARRIRDVVERYRDVGREFRDEVGLVDPVQCAREALDSLSALAKERDIVVHEHIEPVPHLEGSRFLLTHALRQLLKSAIQAAPQGKGDVTLALGLLPEGNEPAQVGFAIADDGPGIELERLPRIFHPFPEGGTAVRGEGFAYAVVYAVARAMGATVVVDSAPGAGTRATLKVPVKRPAPYAQVKKAGETVTV